MIARSMSLVACSAFLTGCLLDRPEAPAPRFFEPEMTPATVAPDKKEAVSVRILAVTARSHIGRPLLIRSEGNELSEDPLWRWAAPAEQYLQDAIEAKIMADDMLVLSDALEAQQWTVELMVCEFDRRDGKRDIRLAARLKLDHPLPKAEQQIYHIDVEQNANSPAPTGLSMASGKAFEQLAEELIAISQQ